MKKTMSYTVTAAMIAAIYAVLTVVISPIAFGPLQLRISEAMVLFATVTPAAIPGLTVGCALANLSSPYGLLDILGGAAASLLASLFAYLVRKIRIKNIPWLAPLGAVLFNGLIVGMIIKITSGSEVLYWAVTGEVALGEMASCYLLGIPLWLAMEKSGLNRRLSLQSR